MIERVARAILKRRFYDCEPDMYVDLDWFFWVMENESAEIWSDAQAEARAAIEAMREPTPEMQAAIPAQSYTIEHYHGSGHHREFPTLSAGPLGIWRAMIDQALKDEA